MSDLFNQPIDNPDIPEMFKAAGVYCPICKSYFNLSFFLHNEIKDKKTLWFANMVMHYRHSHIEYWDKVAGRGGVFHRRTNNKVYHQEKIRVNEKSKRQIMRKCQDYMIACGMNMDTIKGLIYNSEYTLQIAELILVKKQKDTTDESKESRKDLSGREIP